MVALQSCIQKNGGRVVKELGSLGIVIAIEGDEVFVALISIMQVLRVLRLDKVISSCGGKQSWYEAILYVLDGRELIDIKMYFTLNR